MMYGLLLSGIAKPNQGTTMNKGYPNFEATDSPRLLPKVKHLRRIGACEQVMCAYVREADLG